MPKELNLNKRTLKLLAMLIVLFLAVLAVDAIGKADAKKAGQTAEDSVAALFSIDFRRPIAAQLPPCTETGQAFWTMTLARVAELAHARDAEVQGVRVDVDGKAEPYSGLGGEGQIVPVKLVITTLDRRGQTETAVSEVRILMIKGKDDLWLLDALVPDLPASAGK